MVRKATAFIKRLSRSAQTTPTETHRSSKDVEYPRQLGELVSFSVAGVRTLQKQYELATDVIHRGVAGDFVECGVCNGGSAASFGLVLKNQNRKLWLYDSFEGMPPTLEVDGASAAAYVGKYVGNVDNVRSAMAIAGLSETDYVIRKGWFQDTFQRELPNKVAILHLDADWYESITLSLDTFYDRVTDGGIILMDDFGHWEGCREAFYDFVAKRKLKPLLERFGHSQAYWIKGKEHNRP